MFDTLAQRTGVAVVFVTHNLAVACDHAHRAIVLRSGQVVDSRAVDDLVFKPGHDATPGKQLRGYPECLAMAVR